MQKRWTALVLAALMLVTTSCGRTTQPQEDESSSASNPWTPPASSSQAEEPEPVKEPPAWETGRTVEHLPDNYNGLELPIQGATGYTSVELPLWADPADQEAAATAVEEWEKAEEERKRLEEEQKRLEEERARAEAEAAAQAQAQGGTSSPSASSSESAAPAEQTAPDPAASSGGETAPASGETAAGSQEGTSSAQTETTPAQPGETPEIETPAGQEPAPETPATEPDPSGSAGTPAAEPQPPAETEPVEEEEPPTLTDGALALVASGTPFTVLQEEGDWWQVAVTTDYFTDEEQTQTQRGEITGWLEHKYCLVNLPDVIPSIIYDATNSYSSHFRSCGKVIPEVTGEAFYPSKTYNERLGKMEFMMPVLYSMAFKLCEAQQSALAEGNSLILYEGYRPHEVQTKVLNSLSAMTRTDPEVKEAVTGAPWRISWFISGGYSNHQRGYAVDMGLAKVSETKEYTTGGYRYVRVWNYERYEMPTPIHELSRAAATYTAPVTINSTTAWKNAEMTQAMASNEPALGLQRYCTDAELTPLASEWWHFNDLSTRSQVLENQGIGDFLISSVRSAAPV